MEMISLGGMEREGTMCRRICKVLEEGKRTELQISDATGILLPSVCKYLKLLCAEGYVCRAELTVNRRGVAQGRRPRLFVRTGKPLPPVMERAVPMPIREVARTIDAMVRGAR
jgi:hypothetical protein